MDQKIDKWIDRWMYQKIDRWMDQKIDDGWINRYNGQIDGIRQIDIPMDVKIDRFIELII